MYFINITSVHWNIAHVRKGCIVAVGGFSFILSCSYCRYLFNVTDKTSPFLGNQLTFLRGYTVTDLSLNNLTLPVKQRRYPWVILKIYQLCINQTECLSLPVGDLLALSDWDLRALGPGGGNTLHSGLRPAGLSGHRPAVTHSLVSSVLQDSLHRPAVTAHHLSSLSPWSSSEDLWIQTIW